MTQQNINLYDPSLRARREWFTAANAAAAVGACTLAVALAGGWAHHDLAQLRQPAADTRVALQSAQAELVTLTQRAATAKPDARLQGELRLAQAALVQRQSALELLQAGGLGNETGHAGALAAFARQSLNGLWLTGVTLDAQQLALRGRAMAPELIPAYVSRLQQEAALQGRAFQALQIERPLQPADPAASAPARTAPFVEFSLVSAQGAEAPAKTTGKESRP
jgi:hypothetical protein